MKIEFDKKKKLNHHGWNKKQNIIRNSQYK